MALPSVSAQCITYGRPELLEEAIESFLRQDYAGLKELVILNDHPDQELVFEHPDVCVVNMPRRFATVGEKRNACVSLCRGEVILPWDDDDISLPWRISLSVERMAGGRYWKPDAAWLWTEGELRGLRRNVYHAMGAWSKSLFQAVDGYPHLQSGQDAGIEERFRKTGERRVSALAPAEHYYLYRFGGTGHPHLSGYGWDRGWEEIGRRSAAHTGRIALEPRWRADYVSMARDAARKEGGADG